MLHKKFAFSTVLGKKVKLVESVNNTCARFNVAAHRQLLFVSFFSFLAAFALHVTVCGSKAEITVSTDAFTFTS